MKLANTVISTGLLSLCSLSTFAEKTAPPVCLRDGAKLELKPLVYSALIGRPIGKHDPAYILFQDGIPIAVIPQPTQVSGHR